jgi:hypothetical protein
MNNERDCQHGHHERSCYICDLEEEIVELTERHARELRSVGEAVREAACDSVAVDAYGDPTLAVRVLNLDAIIASVTGTASQEQAMQALVDASQELEREQPQPSGGQRAEFEEWAVSEDFNIEMLYEGSDVYAEIATAQAWRGWQARAALASQGAEPAAWLCREWDGEALNEWVEISTEKPADAPDHCEPLYTHPHPAAQGERVATYADDAAREALKRLGYAWEGGAWRSANKRHDPVARITAMDGDNRRIAWLNLDQCKTGDELYIGPQPAAQGVPEGWQLVPQGDGHIIVRHPKIGGYAASANADNIASTILHAFAADVLAAAPAEEMNHG